MTLEEIDNELALLPASPTTRDEILKRADLARKRGEIIEASRRYEMPQAVPAEIAVVPPDGIGSIITVADQVKHAEFIDSQLVIKMGWRDFARLVASRDGGHRWAERNPVFVQQLNCFSF
jgi:hypothetical protein